MGSADPPFWSVDYYIITISCTTLVPSETNKLLQWRCQSITVRQYLSPKLVNRNLPTIGAMRVLVIAENRIGKNFSVQSADNQLLSKVAQ